MVSIGEDSMISLEAMGKIEDQILWEINICTFSLVTIQKNASCISAYDD
jgi:hypothetical protein